MNLGEFVFSLSPANDPKVKSSVAQELLHLLAFDKVCRHSPRSADCKQKAANSCCCKRHLNDFSRCVSPCRALQNCQQGQGGDGSKSLSALGCHQGTGNALCPEFSLTNYIHALLWASCLPGHQTEQGNPHVPEELLPFSLHPRQGSRVSQQ